MTYKEQYQKHDTWQDRVRIMNLFHCLQVAKQKKWGMKETSVYFEVSIGLVSENLLLARNLDKCKHIEFRNDAIQFVRDL